MVLKCEERLKTPTLNESLMLIQIEFVFVMCSKKIIFRTDKHNIDTKEDINKCQN